MRREEVAVDPQGKEGEDFFFVKADKKPGKIR
jgi:hypothetical protein